MAIGAGDLAAPDLLRLLQRIELEFGRDRHSEQRAEAPRTLDLDLLLLGREVRTTEAPILPHPRLRERRFVLAPLCDIAAGWRIPPDDALACALLGQLPESPRVLRLPEELHRLKPPAFGRT